MKKRDGMLGESDTTTQTIESFHGQALESLDKMKEPVEEDGLEGPLIRASNLDLQSTPLHSWL
jgi:hypothetical protein